MSSDVRAALADCIRTYSREGRLFSRSELPEASDLSPDDWRRLFEETAAEHPDLRAIVVGGETGHYSERFMTAAYAGILAERDTDPSALIVRTVRDESQRYPRPVPLSHFEAPPFELGPGELDACLDTIAARPDAGDIARTVTSTGRVFLYSRLYLQPDHAAALAEWIDVGQTDNP